MTDQKINLWGVAGTALFLSGLVMTSIPRYMDVFAQYTDQLFWTIMFAYYSLKAALSIFSKEKKNKKRDNGKAIKN